MLKNIRRNNIKIKNNFAEVQSPIIILGITPKPYESFLDLSFLQKNKHDRVYEFRTFLLEMSG